jgi:hypothetical protein
MPWLDKKLGSLGKAIAAWEKWREKKAWWSWRSWSVLGGSLEGLLGIETHHGGRAFQGGSHGAGSVLQASAWHCQRLRCKPGNFVLCLIRFAHFWTTGYHAIHHAPSHLAPAPGFPCVTTHPPA